MGKLTIQEIARILVVKNKLPQKEANLFTAAMFDIIQQKLDEEGLVKVKGLGTFKMIRVEARESISVRTGERVLIGSHAKVSFTPDATMKELVNKPFSQFETVVLNEGVVFDDLKDDLTEEELAELDRLSESQDAMMDDVPVSVSSVSVSSVAEPPVLESPVAEPTRMVASPPVAAESLPQEEPLEEENVTPESIVQQSLVQQPLMEVVDTVDDIHAPRDVEDTDGEDVAVDVVTTVNDEASKSDEVSEDNAVIFEDDGHTSWKRYWGYGLLTLALMAVSAYGGYWFGQQQRQQELLVTVPDDVEELVNEVVTDSTLTDVMDTDSLLQDTEKGLDGESLQQTPAEAEPAVAEPVGKEKSESEESDAEWKKYEAMDVRVRTGAYRIVGTDHVVKVRQGETLQRICRRELGDGMSCYVEVYNGISADTELKEGQTIKIPKLQWKVKRKH